ncbi:juvenile hormone esterase-like [Oratosquilla oratoria]|uniref:juvenile hormone esterase-like n=1 Tax=Oratosquilla oratoria TaxID=337810 RepID=UPI003F75D46A
MGPSSLLALVLGVAAVAVTNAGGDATIEVDIDQGRLSGVTENTLKGRPYYAFRGIPYAKPPVGPLRFKDPEPAEGWYGTRNASAHPPKCIQTPVDLLFLDIRIVDGEEDCLYLSVYTPEIEVSSGYPVMVFIHGGAFLAGESSSYEARVLLDHEVILVVLQYRLGIIGFLSTEDSTIPGNFGLKDQTLALQWVQKNIGHFGGDPDKVTIFGESAGAASVMYQMLIPESKGLFIGGIMQSGSAIHKWAIADTHAKNARQIGQIVNCSLDEGSQAYLTCMQNISASLLVSTVAESYKIVYTPFDMVPRVDGVYLRDHPVALIAAGHYHQVPVIVGITAHEGAILTNYIYSSDERRKKFADDISLMSTIMFFDTEPPHVQEKLVRKAFNYYVGDLIVDNHTADAVTQMIGENALTVPQDFTSQLLSHRSPVYSYELRHRGQRSFGDYANTTFSRRWVQHADELIYIFATNRLKPLDRVEDLRLSDTIAILWTNFAKMGNPTPDDSLGFRWDTALKSSLHHLILQPRPFMENDTRKKTRDFWLEFPAYQPLWRVLYSGKSEL